MPSERSNLFSLARSKLHVPVDKGNCSLHRWVLLKNSIIRSLPLTTSTSASETQISCSSDYDDEDEAIIEESDAFMFPDAGKLADGSLEEVNTSEAAWLDSLLENLADDDEDYSDTDVHVSILPVDDEDDQSLSPSISPMSSSDDLPQSAFFPTAIDVQYPVPYPPLQPPFIRSYTTFDSSLTSSPPLYDDPLPYYELEDDVPPVPDAIEDLSDDESEDPPTPSVGQSTSSLSLDPASIPLPGEHSSLRHLIHPQVYNDADNSYFYPLEFDPPFPDGRRPSYIYQEC